MKHIHTFESFINEAANKMVTKQDWDKADNEQRENWLLSAIKDPDDVEKFVNAKWDKLPDVATSNMMKESINEASAADGAALINSLVADINAAALSGKLKKIQSAKAIGKDEIEIEMDFETLSLKLKGWR